MRRRSCGTTRPAPRFKCPTSELPINPAESPTDSPEASSSVDGYSRSHRSNTGVRASAIALPADGGATPQPSQITSTTGRIFGPNCELRIENCEYAKTVPPYSQLAILNSQFVSESRGLGLSVRLYGSGYGSWSR